MLFFKLQKRNLVRAFENDTEGFTMPELLVVIVLIALLASFSVPSLSRWINNERKNTYINELRDFIPLLLRESRRWGGSCSVNINRYIPSGVEASGLKVNCIGIGKASRNNIKNGPNISKFIFQEASSDFTVTPKGQIYTSNNSPIVFIVGMRDGTGRNQPKCIVFELPVGSSRTGLYTQASSFSRSRSGSSINPRLKTSSCK